VGFGFLTATQSALRPGGVEAAGILQISGVLFAGAAVLFALVMIAVALALWAPPRWLTRPSLVVGGGVVLPLVLLTALLVYTLLASTRPVAAGVAAVAIEVRGHQWWWEVHYLDERGALDFVTANEIRIPVGAEVELRLASEDVLHSFWVPPLAGKLDLIPGRVNRMRVRADETGVYRGQCAEYCGGPHALMALYVVAEESERFAAWRAQQRRPRPVVATGNEVSDAPGDKGAQAQRPLQQGEKLFLSRCAVCHTVRGTPARGTLGPDLTHLASRLSIGAGILPNNAGSIAGWIAGNQQLKPGNLMPEFRNFSGDELLALARYLGSSQ
jgi:cytochrome c oxidase subunit 2